MVPSRTHILYFLTFFLTSSVLAGPQQYGKKTKCNNGKKVNDGRCCVWFDVLDQVQDELFGGGECDEVAHDALRLSFHDAAGYSKSLKKQNQFPGGGADGSLMIFSDQELAYPGNDGLDEIVNAEKLIAMNYNVTWGDFIQFTGAVSVGNCGGGPKLPFWGGRPNATQPAPESGLLPDAGDTVDHILARMKDAGFNKEEVVALLASHSVGMQEQQDKSIPFTPFDTTPEILDSQFYLEVLFKGTAYPGSGPHKPTEVKSPLPGEFRLQSDFAIARDSRTACIWQDFLVNEAKMRNSFAEAMDKMAIVGHDRDDLYDCSDVIPTPSRPLPPTLPTIPAGLSATDIEFSCKPGNAVKSLPKKKGPLYHVPRFDKGHDRLISLSEAGKKKAKKQPKHKRWNH